MQDDTELEAAIAAQREGRFGEAEALLRELLEARPDHPAALHYSGLLQYQTGRPDDAVATIERALELDPGMGGAWNNLGNIHKRQGRPDRACDCYHAAIQASPGDPDPWCNMGVLLRDSGDTEKAVGALEHALELDPQHSESWHNLAICHMRANRVDEAVEAFDRVFDGPPRRWQNPFWHFQLLERLGRREAAMRVLERYLVARPGDPLALHHMNAVTGQPVARAPDDYVRRHFDSFATSFDQVLQRLSYRGPELVADEVRRLVGDQVIPDVVDLGCGTGLVGPLIAPQCRRLVGVDLSSVMLRHAAQREVYTHLVESEISEFLTRVPANTFDLAVSVDTLIYFGDLAPVMRGLASALRFGGVLVATVEALPPDEGSGYRLNASGRYSHTEAYLRATAEAAGLRFHEATTVVLRKEFGEPVDGFLFTLAKPPRA